jgi:hypothetical protein
MARFVLNSCWESRVIKALPLTKPPCRDDPSPRPPRSRKQVNAVTTIAIPKIVQRVRPPAFPAETPDFFSMIDQQARMVVNLARTASEVLQGKESAHSLRLLDLEQRREELQRRNRAAVDSMLELRSGIEEIHWTMETLDRAAAGLFRTARSFHQLLSGPDEVAGQMLGVIQKAAESLQHGYARLANGSPAAECDADEAMASRHVLGRYRAQTLWGRGGSIPGVVSGSAVGACGREISRPYVLAERTLRQPERHRAGTFGRRGHPKRVDKAPYCRPARPECQNWHVLAGLATVGDQLK